MLFELFDRAHLSVTKNKNILHKPTLKYVLELKKLFSPPPPLITIPGYALLFNIMDITGKHYYGRQWRTNKGVLG